MKEMINSLIHDRDKHKYIYWLTLFQGHLKRSQNEYITKRSLKEVY